MDTIANRHFVPYSEVSVIPLRMVLRNWTVEHIVTAFSELSFAVCW